MRVRRFAAQATCIGHVVVSWFLPRLKPKATPYVLSRTGRSSSLWHGIKLLQRDCSFVQRKNNKRKYICLNVNSLLGESLLLFPCRISWGTSDSAHFRLKQRNGSSLPISNSGISQDRSRHSIRMLDNKLQTCHLTNPLPLRGDLSSGTLICGQRCC